MAELADVEVFCQYLDSTSLHHADRERLVSDKNILWQITPNEFQSILKGNQIRTSTRHGKYILARFIGNNFLGCTSGCSAV